MSVYRTNLVKCAPIDSEKRLRYPNDKEINACFEKLTDEINNIAPKLIILLGILLESHFKLISISIYVNLKKIVYKS